MCMHQKTKKQNKTSAAKDAKQKLIELKGKTDKSTVVVGDFNVLFSTIDRTNRQNQQG